MSYGADLRDLIDVRQLTLINLDGRGGPRPADLPVKQASNIYLSSTLKTATGAWPQHSAGCAARTMRCANRTAICCDA